ncbi:MAG: hypothetical protein ABIQ35_04785 [Verrucomicrobiota bacterium]
MKNVTTNLSVIFSLILMFVVCAKARGDGDFQGATHLMPFDEGTLNYNKLIPDDPVSRLQQALNKGEAKLTYKSDDGYLESVLDKLDIPKSSQVLVFSKTSFQRDLISPRTPRALFFNDDVYIGFIPGAPLMEVSTADPKIGGVFYTLDQSGDSKPKFARTDQCLECHASARSMGVPGHLLRSSMTDASGSPDLSNSISDVNHRTPIEDRWGGWYVTGKSGEQSHHGNLIGKADFARAEKEPNVLGNISDLSRFFDVTRYPGTNSDIVALMVLQHQVHMHNFITRLRYESTVQLERYGHINYVTNIANAFLKYALFVEEAPIKSPIRGNSTFTEDFQDRGPKDAQGRSLRQFDLQTRLFKYPCSYLIYSKSFDAIPAKMKEFLYQRLWEILRDRDDFGDYDKISPEAKRSILEIIIATKKDLPTYWTLK